MHRKDVKTLIKGCAARINRVMIQTLLSALVFAHNMFHHVFLVLHLYPGIGILFFFFELLKYHIHSKVGLVLHW